MEHIGQIKIWVILAAAAVTSWLGMLAVPLGLLVLVSVIDYVTGLIAAPKRGQVRNSERGFAGLVKKICSWLLVAVGMIIDVLLGYLVESLGWVVPVGFAVATLVCVWLLANELLSIVENISDITGNVPPFLKPVIEWVKKQAEGKGEMGEKEE